jgi:hypothetical protein
MKGARRWGRWLAADEAFDRGGQGHVYRVVDSDGKHTGTFVLKELINPERQARFENEIKAIESLGRHPNVIHLIDSGGFRDKRKPFYVMPNADGGSLEGVVMGASHNVARVLDMFDQILLGVAHIHAASIIHRDLKPENILMFGGVPKISDMGLALITKLPRITPTSEAVGPRYYMAPELEDGRCLDVTRRADIYSLGKVLYFMLSEGKLFAREKYQSPEWRLSKLYDDERFDLFLPLFRGTMAVSPRDRFDSVADLRRASSDVAVRFAAHPGTTLRTKAPVIDQELIAPATILEKLDLEEWVEFLELRKRRGAAFSPELIAAARVSLKPALAGRLAAEVLRHQGEMDHALIVEICAEIVKVGAEGVDVFFTLSDKWGQVQLLALESRDPVVASIIGKDVSASPEVLKDLLAQYDLLDAEARESAILGVADKRIEGQERLLLEISRAADLSNSMLAMVVAGLMQAASDTSLDRVAELLRSPTNRDALGAIIEGIAFRGSPRLYSALLNRGGYSKAAVALLAVLMKASEAPPEQ